MDGAGFALFFTGQIMGGMALAILAMAAWAAATPVDQDQTGGQDWGLGLKLFKAGQQVAANKGGMLGNFDGSMGARWHIRLRISKHTYPKRQQKSCVRRNIFGGLRA